ncbi:MAG: hypothetical protein U1F35_03515 [Steroidobacteraceae bacterium]
MAVVGTSSPGALSILAAGCGCLLFLAFWDVDQVMLLGAGLMLMWIQRHPAAVEKGAYVRPYMNSTSTLAHTDAGWRDSSCGRP